MIAKFLFFSLGLSLSYSVASAQSLFEKQIDKEIPRLETTYHTLHSVPELSGHEEKTSALIASQLKQFGYAVTENVGKFAKPWKGYGVVALLKNGNGPVVMIRTDMDGLPIEEKTGLPFASSVKTKGESGEQVNVMHACGHDIHMTVFLGVAKLMNNNKSSWKGTLMLVAQPSEEGGPGASGAEAMLADSLFSKFPKPDFILGLHQTPELESGKVGLVSGYATSVSAAGEITITGIGGHSAKPHTAKDPIVMSAELILALQTIASRETNPLDPVTLTIGAISGGTAANVIPDQVQMKYSVRTLSPEVLDKTIVSMMRIAKGIGTTAGMPEDKFPKITVLKGYPSVYNDPDLTTRMKILFKKTLGDANVKDVKPTLTGEDFSYYRTDGGIPSLFFQLGGAEPQAFKESVKTGIPLPANHSPRMIPDAAPTIKTGIIAMSTAAMDLLRK